MHCTKSRVLKFGLKSGDMVSARCMKGNNLWRCVQGPPVNPSITWLRAAADCNWNSSKNPRWQQVRKTSDIYLAETGAALKLNLLQFNVWLHADSYQQIMINTQRQRAHSSVPVWTKHCQVKLDSALMSWLHHVERSTHILYSRRSRDTCV